MVHKINENNKKNIELQQSYTYYIYIYIFNQFIATCENDS